jgi:hypothetical protein
MVGIASGPPPDHSVGTAGCALATFAAPSCAVITGVGWPRATSEAAASSPQLAWSTRRVVSVRGGTAGLPTPPPECRTRVSIVSDLDRPVHRFRHGSEHRRGRRRISSPATAGHGRGRRGRRLIPRRRRPRASVCPWGRAPDALLRRTLALLGAESVANWACVVVLPPAAGLTASARCSGRDRRSPIEGAIPWPESVSSSRR